MFASTMNRVMQYVSKRFSTSPTKVLKEINDDAVQQRILALLEGLPADTTFIPVRDLHVLAATNQSRILRAVRALENAGLVHIDEIVHDPLASRVSLAA